MSRDEIFMDGLDDAFDEKKERDLMHGIIWNVFSVFFLLEEKF